MGLLFGVTVPVTSALEVHSSYGEHGVLYALIHLSLVLTCLNCVYVFGSQFQILFVLQLSLVYDKLAAGSVLEYRTLAIMTTIFNESYGYAFAPLLQYILSAFVMVCFVGAVRMPGTDLVTTGVRAGLVLIAVYYCVMLLCGEKLVTHSLAPIRFSVGGLYYMEREARLTFIHFLANGTLSLLIAFKSVA